MDFFGEQDRAKRNTWWLLVLFCTVLVVISGVVLAGLWAYFPAFFCQGGFNGSNSNLKDRLCFDNMNLKNVVSTVTAIVSFLAMMSVWKYAQISSGGKIVAEAMGGRQINTASKTDKEKRLLNVVEEISIAAGCPVPLVYIIDSSSINAFAAGTTLQNAVIGVTSGAVEHFTRDELQAVIGHEFSHILNGDMKLNMNLIGACYGILGFYYIGRSFFRIRGGSKSGKSGGHPYLLVAGLGLMVVGGLGFFFGSLIKAGVSRQREFLADASAVQFTRNPGSMENALKKTASVGSVLTSRNAAEYSHMFFSDGLKRFIGGIFSTHPPLNLRLKKINPRFRDSDLEKFSNNYSLPVSNDLAAAVSGLMPLGDAASERVLPPETAQKSSPSHASSVGHKPADIVHTAGVVTPEAEEEAKKMLSGLDPELTKNAREPYGARALVFALLINENKASIPAQSKIISRLCGPDVLQLVEKIIPLVEGQYEIRLPLIDLSLPALRNLSLGQTHVFLETLERLVDEDKEISLFEFTLYTVVKFNLHKQAKIGLRKTLPKLGTEESIARLISVVVHASSSRLKDPLSPLQLEVYRHTLRSFPRAHAYLQSVPEWDVTKLEGALFKASTFTFEQKKFVLERLAEAAAADDYIDIKEVEIIRGIGDRLACPIPPIAMQVRQIAVA